MLINNNVVDYSTSLPADYTDSNNNVKAGNKGSGADVKLSNIRNAADAGDIDHAQDMVLILADLVTQEAEDRNGKVEVRKNIRDKLMGLSSEKRQEVVATLKELAQSAAGTELGDLLDGKLPDVEKEAGKGSSIDRLMELLFALLLLLGKANTERNANAAKMSEVSVAQAKFSGINGVNAANSNLYGAVTAMVLGVTIAGVGTGIAFKGAQKQITNIKTNVRSANALKEANLKNDAALRQHSGAPAAERNSQERFHDLETKDGSKIDILDDQSHLTNTDVATINKSVQANQVLISSSEVAANIGQHDAAQYQLAGQILAGVGAAVGGVGAAGYSLMAEGQRAASKINDAEATVASTLEHSETQGAQRMVDLLEKIFALIASAMDTANRNIADLSRSIGA